MGRFSVFIGVHEHREPSHVPVLIFYIDKTVAIGYNYHIITTKMAG